MKIPSNDEILAILDQLDASVADDLESYWLEFKPWRDPKEDMRVAAETAACFANADGGVIVFGVADRIRGRVNAIHGASRYDMSIWRSSIFASTRPNLDVEVGELPVDEGSGKLLVVRVQRGLNPPYGTAEGMYKVRVSKNCMPLDPQAWARIQVSTGAVDWSGQAAEGVGREDIDPVEIARARNILKRVSPESELLKLDDGGFLAALGAIRSGRVTHTGLLLFAQESKLAEKCPQHQVHYVYETSDTEVARNDSYRSGLLDVLERLEQTFTGPANPEQELSLGLFKLRIPAFPVDVVREAVLNAVTHRDYSDPNEVLVRHTRRELVVTSPGGFLANISPGNILRAEPISRNRCLAEAFQRLRLVERAGIGRRRIFTAMLSYGKRLPVYETDGFRVTLRLFDGGYDERTATLVAQWKKAGREVDLDGLLVLAFLRENAFLDSVSAAKLLQVERDQARSILDHLAQPQVGILERRGRTKAVTYHLTKAVARDLLGKAAYTKTRGLDPIRYAEMVKAFVADHGSISPRECRELLGLGESQSSRVQVSQMLARWSTEDGFLRREGQSPKVKYYPRT